MTDASVPLRELARQLLRWYRQHGRQLPWRQPDASEYEVTVAEFMLQQTQVATVLPYYRRFLQAYPSFAALAAADDGQVLRLWQGLGYYRRAWALRDLARAVCRDHGGRLPKDPKDLRRLPGVGRYTADAIRAFAQGIPVLPVDGNVKRVIARLFRLRLPVDRGEGERHVRELAKAWADAARDPELGHAVMDLGATICLPQAPHCEQCPVRQYCQGYAAGDAHRLPVLQRTVPPTQLQEWTLVIRRDGTELLLLRRKPGIRWGGLWEFPRLPRKPESTPEEVPQRLSDRGLEVVLEGTAKEMTYQVTRFRIRMIPWLGRYQAGQLRLGTEHVQAAWVPARRLADYPLPTPHRRLAKRLIGP